MKPPKLSMKFKRIDLLKSKGCKHPDISPSKQYFVNYNGYWIFGNFTEQWYGWNFNWFGSDYAGLQLDSLNEVWEVNIKKL